MAGTIMAGQAGGFTPRNAGPMSKNPISGRHRRTAAVRRGVDQLLSSLRASGPCLAEPPDPERASASGCPVVTPGRHNCATRG